MLCRVIQTVPHVVNANWQTTDGSSIIQSNDAVTIIPSLAEVYHRFPGNTSFRNYIKAYMGVQVRVYNTHALSPSCF